MDRPNGLSLASIVHPVLKAQSFDGVSRPLEFSSIVFICPSRKRFWRHLSLPNNLKGESLAVPIKGLQLEYNNVSFIALFSSPFGVKYFNRKTGKTSRKAFQESEFCVSGVHPFSLRAIMFTFHAARTILTFVPSLPACGGSAVGNALESYARDPGSKPARTQMCFLFIYSLQRRAFF